MNIKLHYGLDSELKISSDDQNLLYFHGQNTPTALGAEELLSEVRQSLETPINFPSFRECLLDDDRLVIPIAPGIPQIELILQSVLKYVFSGPEIHRPAYVTILRTKEDEAAGKPRLEKILSDESMKKRVEIVTHHPEKKEETAWLGVAATNETIVINRKMFDAEMVLPIGYFLPKNTSGNLGIHTAIYPLFSDEQTQKRYENYGPQLHASNHELMHQLKDEAAEATRQLGVQCMIQVVPGIPARGKTGIARVMVGEFHELEVDGYSLYREIWTNHSSQKPELVLASVTGTAASDWSSVMAALVNASRLAPNDGGIIVLCSELGGELPRSLEIWRHVQNFETAAKFIRREELPDAALAVEMLRVLTTHRVFFLSRLDGNLLEEIGIMPLTDEMEFERLLAKCHSFSILPDAQRIIF
ncbi:MAG: hypothetical protein E7028_09945 [Planctomycetaceae bacterium]|nr:hypothetical protein [Planctomycetaceae bacterium]